MAAKSIWKRGGAEFQASRSVDLWRPEERLPREPNPARAGRARLRRALQRSRERFLQVSPGKRW